MSIDINKKINDFLRTINEICPFGIKKVYEIEELKNKKILVEKNVELLAEEIEEINENNDVFENEIQEKIINLDKTINLNLVDNALVEDFKEFKEDDVVEEEPFDELKDSLEESIVENNIMLLTDSNLIDSEIIEDDNLQKTENNHDNDINFEKYHGYSSVEFNKNDPFLKAMMQNNIEIEEKKYFEEIEKEEEEKEKTIDGEYIQIEDNIPVNEQEIEKTSQENNNENSVPINEQETRETNQKNNSKDDTPVDEQEIKNYLERHKNELIQKFINKVNNCNLGDLIKEDDEDDLDLL